MCPRTYRTLLLVLPFGTILAGCGGGEKSAPPVAQQASAPPVAQQAVGGQPAQPGGPGQAGRPQASPAAAEPVHPTDEPWPDGVPPQNVFRAFSKPEPNFVVGDASGGPHPRDWFVAVRPRDGSDSQSFAATLPEWANESQQTASPQRLPDGFTPDAAAGYSNEGWPRRIRCTADGAVMVFVPGGAFLQGMDGVDANAGPAHPADVDSFYIDQTEVTVGQYRRFLESGALAGERKPQPPVNANAPSDHPALGVAWGDAQAYADWAGKALPSETEWELAGRGPRSFIHPWGNGRAVWESVRGRQQIDAVGTYRGDRSIYNVLDMSGSAREWVADFYHERAYDQSKAVDGSVIRNWMGPKRPSPANHKVVKGGGPNWELWHRTSASMRQPDPDISFRCVLRLSTPAESADTADEGRVPATSARRPASGL